MLALTGFDAVDAFHFLHCSDTVESFESLPYPVALTKIWFTTFHASSNVILGRRSFQIGIRLEQHFITLGRLLITVLSSASQGEMLPDWSTRRRIPTADTI